MVNFDKILLAITAILFTAGSVFNYSRAKKGEEWAKNKRQQMYCAREPKLTHFVLDLYAEIQQAFEVCRVLSILNLALLIMVVTLMQRAL